ncbi:MAG: Ig-like domain-containing protein, partial [Planctomycetota bacterium]|nr:Ig-like domain-containing protein [Planctomycetota bacterium]
MRPNSSVRPYRRSNAGISPAAELLEARILLAAPVAKDDAVATDENTVLTGNVLADNGFGADSDADADPITVAVVNGNAGAVGTMITLASGAKLTVNANGSFTYDPSGAFSELALGESAMDTFTYRITDGTNSSNVATVTVTIAGANSPPVVTGETLQGSKNAVIFGNVLANDSDPDGDTLAVSAVNGNPASVGTTITLASGSTVRVLANGSFEYAAGGKLKRLEAGESAFDSFTYAVSDGNGGTGSATVTIRVNGEGFEDIVGYHQGTWQIGKSTGSAFATSVTQSANIAWDAIAYGDFNADGRTDVVGFIDGSWR